MYKQLRCSKCLLLISIAQFTDQRPDLGTLQFQYRAAVVFRRVRKMC